jgi:hypothetical protein
MLKTFARHRSQIANTGRRRNLGGGAMGLTQGEDRGAPPSGESEDPICSLPQARQSSIFLFQKG